MLLILFYIIDYYLIGIIISSLFNYLRNNQVIDIEFFFVALIWPIILVATIYKYNERP